MNDNARILADRQTDRQIDKRASVGTHILKRQKDFAYLGIILLLYIVALLITSKSTSPLYPHVYGEDSALFSLLGKGILQGKTLYAELFDHKGPVIFYINALGQLLGGYTGILFLQCLFGCVSICFLYYTAKILCGTQKKHQSALPFLLVHILCFSIPFRGEI